MISVSDRQDFGRKPTNKSARVGHFCVICRAKLQRAGRDGVEYPSPIVVVARGRRWRGGARAGVTLERAGRDCEVRGDFVQLSYQSAPARVIPIISKLDYADYPY